MIDVIPSGPFRTNSLVVHLDGPDVFIVDPADSDFSADKGTIVSYLKKCELNPVAVVLTHGHFDHVAGLQNLLDNFPDIPVLIHKNDSMMIGKGSEKVQEEALELMGFGVFDPFVSNLPECDFFLEDNKTLFEVLNVKNSKNNSKLNDWRVMWTPGHTRGSVCLYNKAERVLIAGDTIFYTSYGRTDLPGGSEIEIHKSIKKIVHEILGNTTVYAGHDECGFMLSSCYVYG